jgi:hypothetical protein
MNFKIFVAYFKEPHFAKLSLYICCSFNDNVTQTI